jgi:hypothetical protein
MQYDERDPGEPEHLDDLRRDPATEPPQEPIQPSHDAPSEPAAQEPAPPEGVDARGEPPAEEPPAEEPPAGGWPSEDFAGRDQEPAAAPAGEPAPWPDEPPPAEQPPPAEPPPPEATWPPAAHEPPPSEVEAYPTAAGGQVEGEPAPPAHSVPAAGEALGESTLCPRCGTENRPGLAFCRNCGQRLMAAGAPATVERPSAPEGTRACPRCGTHNRAGVAFCQNCGANLRAAAPGYVPPPVETAAGERVAPAEARRTAVLGPVVLLIAVVGIVTAYLLPFLYGTGSLFERAFGSGGYGIAFWNGYPEVTASLADQAYFGLAAPAPLVVVLLVALAIGGFVRAAPGAIQTIGLIVALLWAVGVVLLFLMVELAANLGGDLVRMLSSLSAGGIIFFLSALIVLIGILTRFARS